MKKIIFAAITFAIGITAFGSCVIFSEMGNGNLVSSERSFSSFEKINGSGSAEVRFYASQEYRVVVTADSNLIDNVETYVRNNTLTIGTKHGVYSFTELTVDVYCPALTAVSMSGSRCFSSNDTITASTFDANLSGSGKINGTIDCNNFYARISGSGNITINGNSKDSNIDISGSGKFDGNEFSANNAVIRISGSGKAYICVTDDLQATISGSGELYYRGNPNVKSSVTGSGRIKKM